MRHDKTALVYLAAASSVQTPGLAVLKRRTRPLNGRVRLEFTSPPMYNSGWAYLPLRGHWFRAGLGCQGWSRVASGSGWIRVGLV